MTASVTSAPAQVSVGDSIAVRLSFECAPGARVVLTNPPSSSSLERISAGPWAFRKTGNAWTVERTEKWASFAPGTTANLRYGLRGADGGSQEVSSPPIRTVSVLAAGNTAPAPFAPPMAKTYVPWEWVAGASLALLVVLAFARLLRRRRPGRYSPKSPDELFDQELSFLEEKLSRAEPDGEFFDWLAETTRWYLEQKLRIPASRETSWEISRDLGLQSTPMPSADIARVFAACDGYRFARLQTRRDQAADALAAARRAAAAIRETLAPTEMSA